MRPLLVSFIRASLYIAQRDVASASSISVLTKTCMKSCGWLAALETPLICEASEAPAASSSKFAGEDRRDSGTSRRLSLLSSDSTDAPASIVETVLCAKSASSSTGKWPDSMIKAGSMVEAGSIVETVLRSMKLPSKSVDVSTCGRTFMSGSAAVFLGRRLRQTFVAALLARILFAHASALFAAAAWASSFFSALSDLARGLMGTSSPASGV
mmetsp:Transcript_17453/g.32960  ORF Transcript_17453/g.32960 Transcript_17453/m.32960 type:complete len:212 (+) Transcript_17453:322-957(+)